MNARQFIEDLELQGRRVLVRTDFNVPLDQDRNIIDPARIQAALPTIRRVIEQGGRAILMSHLGRPNGKPIDSMSLYPVAEQLSKLLGQSVPLAPDCIGPEVEKQVEQLTDGEVLLLENLRFHESETRNDPGFCRSLARLGEVYINDAFGTAHRAHASTAGVAALLEKKAVGYLIKKELDFLGDAVNQPKEPFIAILGGAKVSDKIKVIERLMERVQTLIIGGGMACTFLKAKGYDVGGSLLEEDELDYAESLMKKDVDRNPKILLPTDVYIGKELSGQSEVRIQNVETNVPAGWKILDIGPESVEHFGEAILQAGTVLWNGPMGVFEIPAFAKGTEGISKALARSTEKGCVSIVGGGDSAAAIRQFGLEQSMSHISTGGGASLEFLEGHVLAGVAAIPERRIP